MRNVKSMTHVFFFISVFLFACALGIQAEAVTQTQKVTKPSLQLKTVLPDITITLKKGLSRVMPTASRGMGKALVPGETIGKRVKIVVKNIGKRRTGRFFVDLVLSSDMNVPVKPAVYSPVYQEDVLLLGGRVNVDNLAPGAVKTLSLPEQSKIPDKIKPGTYYLAAVADTENVVRESNEANNIAMRRIRVKIPMLYPIVINSVGQTGYWSSGCGSIEVNLGGSGFGTVIGNKTVKIGTHTFGASNMEAWLDTGVIVCMPHDFPFGNRFDIQIMENGHPVSNKKKNVLLYMDITQHEFTDADGSPIDYAQAGDTIRMSGLFGTNQGSCVVKFGGVNAQIVSWAYSGILFVLPNLAPGSYPVFVEKNGTRVSVQVNFTIAP